jgi:hypothetical protein
MNDLAVATPVVRVSVKNNGKKEFNATEPVDVIVIDHDLHVKSRFQIGAGKVSERKELPVLVLDIHDGEVTNLHSNQAITVDVAYEADNAKNARHALTTETHDGSNGIDLYYVEHHQQTMEDPVVEVMNTGSNNTSGQSPAY